MEQLKTLRKKLNQTQSHIAKYLGITVSAYGNYELGQREPDIKTLIKLADYFGVSVDYLLGHDTQQLPISRPKYELAEKFATDYAELLKDRNFLDITKLCNAASKELIALALGYIVGLFYDRGVNTKAILGY